jgi:hypothetical protein
VRAPGCSGPVQYQCVRAWIKVSDVLADVPVGQDTAHLSHSAASESQKTGRPSSAQPECRSVTHRATPGLGQGMSHVSGVAWLPQCRRYQLSWQRFRLSLYPLLRWQTLSCRWASCPRGGQQGAWTWASVPASCRCPAVVCRRRRLCFSNGGAASTCARNPTETPTSPRNRARALPEHAHHTPCHVRRVRMILAYPRNRARPAHAKDNTMPHASAHSTRHCASSDTCTARAHSREEAEAAHDLIKRVGLKFFALLAFHEPRL